MKPEPQVPGSKGTGANTHFPAEMLPQGKRRVTGCPTPSPEVQETPSGHVPASPRPSPCPHQPRPWFVPAAEGGWGQEQDGDMGDMGEGMWDMGWGRGIWDEEMGHGMRPHRGGHEEGTSWAYLGPQGPGGRGGDTLWGTGVPTMSPPRGGSSSWKEANRCPEAIEDT